MLNVFNVTESEAKQHLSFKLSIHYVLMSASSVTRLIEEVQPFIYNVVCYELNTKHTLIINTVRGVFFTMTYSHDLVAS